MAPVPRLIVVKAILWVINTLHDQGSLVCLWLPPVSHTLAKYGADAISARLLLYSWARVPVSSLPPPVLVSSMVALYADAILARLPMYSTVMGIGESYVLPVDNYYIYARCSGPCSRAKPIYGHYLWPTSCSSRSHTSHVGYLAMYLATG